MVRVAGPYRLLPAGARPHCLALAQAILDLCWASYLEAEAANQVAREHKREAPSDGNKSPHRGVPKSR